MLITKEKGGRGREGERGRDGEGERELVMENDINTQLADLTH